MDHEELTCLASFLGERVDPGKLSEIAHEAPTCDLRYADCKSYEITSTAFLQDPSLSKHIWMPRSLMLHWVSQKMELVTDVFVSANILIGVQIHKYRHLPHGAIYETEPIRMELYFVRKILSFITDANNTKG